MKKFNIQFPDGELRVMDVEDILDTFRVYVEELELLSELEIGQMFDFFDMKTAAFIEAQRIS